MKFVNYNELLETSDLDNFKESLKYKSGSIFNNLINTLSEEGIEHSISKGFNKDSKDENFSQFKKIEMTVNCTDKKIKEVFKNYSLDEVLNIEKIKTKKYIITVKEEGK